MYALDAVWLAEIDAVDVDVCGGIHLRSIAELQFEWLMTSCIRS